MAYFMIRFLISNLMIIGIVGFILMIKKVFKRYLSSRMHYRLWVLFLGLLIVPFLPFRIFNVPQLAMINASAPYVEKPIEIIEDVKSNPGINQTNDFTLSVGRTLIVIDTFLFKIWITGIVIMALAMIKSFIRLCHIKISALPVQHLEFYNLYQKCLVELHITKYIPVYSTVFLRSPMIAGCIRPTIYLPTHLISHYNSDELYYMLLHELQHYKHRDHFINCVMNMTRILYWFNPCVWYALREMRCDREIACDTSVLKMLREEDYIKYGYTLLNFIEKLSFSSISTGLSGNKKQIQRRILNIVSYEKPAFKKRLSSISIFSILAIFLLGCVPLLSTYVEDENYYHWNSYDKNIVYLNLSPYFKGYEGSFVLYDLEKDLWNIYHKEHATLRVAPNSTYKIYSALYGLEENIITPENSLLEWDGSSYPFEAWNKNQTLHSAMASSVNWYFQKIDSQIGKTSIQYYIDKIGYGNKKISNDLTNYWLESSLKISPIEQVELLVKLYQNSFKLNPKNIETIKDSICLFSSDKETFYGKTGTGRINHQDVSGWFIGYFEIEQKPYFFATHIKADKNATGNDAKEITISILKKGKDIY